MYRKRDTRDVTFVLINTWLYLSRSLYPWQRTRVITVQSWCMWFWPIYVHSDARISRTDWLVICVEFRNSVKILPSRQKKTSPQRSLTSSKKEKKNRFKNFFLAKSKISARTATRGCEGILSIVKRRIILFKTYSLLALALTTRETTLEFFSGLRYFWRFTFCI